MDPSDARQAAERGVVSAQIQLGLALLDGRDVAADPAEAFYWLSAAAARGAARALYHVARMHLQGIGTARNEELGASLLERAAAAGEFMACIELARAKVAAADLDSARRWYQAALAQKDRIEAPSEVDEATRFLSTP